MFCLCVFFSFLRDEIYTCCSGLFTSIVHILFDFWIIVGYCLTNGDKSLHSQINRLSNTIDNTKCPFCRMLPLWPVLGNSRYLCWCWCYLFVCMFWRRRRRRKWKIITLNLFIAQRKFKTVNFYTITTCLQKTNKYFFTVAERMN